jgi:hypothetical protein
MRKVDLQALRRAMRIAKASDSGRRQQLESKLADEPWEEVAVFAAYVGQTEALHLKPWQPPPMHADDDRPRDDLPSAGKVAAWELRRRLLAAGLSEFEPNPVAVLEAVAARQCGEAPPVGRHAEVH